MTSDIVFIEDLRIDTIIGIYDWEREVKQTIALHIEMAADNTKAAATEDIDDALNYKAVAKRLIVRRHPEYVVLGLEQLLHADQVHALLDHEVDARHHVLEVLVPPVGPDRLAERLAEIIINEFDVPWCRLKLSKLGAVTGSRSVGVIIERGQR